MMHKKTLPRTGSVATLLCVLLLPLLGLLALFVDYGFLLYVRTDLQRTADHAALAAVKDLVPDRYGNQDLEKVRETVRSFAAQNLGNGFQILDADIEIGRYDPESIYKTVELLNDGIFDTVRITLRRDDLANSSVSLFFARVFNQNESGVNVTAAAVLQRARFLESGADVLPVAVDQTLWNNMPQGEITSIYGDGRIEDLYGNSVPGNFGTLDIGPNGNSTSELNVQIDDGLSEQDLIALNEQGAISDPTRIDSQQNPLFLNGDTGFSSGLKHSVRRAHGTNRLIPIFGSFTGQGGGFEFDVVGWSVVEIVGSEWAGSRNSLLQVRKSYMYDGDLRPNSDLSDQSNSIESAFTSPILVQ